MRTPAAIALMPVRGRSAAPAANRRYQNPVTRRIVVPPAITSILPLSPPTAGLDPVGDANLTGTNSGIDEEGTHERLK
jgi:hypothetical protein